MFLLFKFSFITLKINFTINEKVKKDKKFIESKTLSYFIGVSLISNFKPYNCKSN